MFRLHFTIQKFYWILPGSRNSSDNASSKKREEKKVMLIRIREEIEQIDGSRSIPRVSKIIMVYLNMFVNN